jgi:hypothetical protein
MDIPVPLYNQSRSRAFPYIEASYSDELLLPEPQLADTCKARQEMIITFNNLDLELVAL